MVALCHTPQGRVLTTQAAVEQGGRKAELKVLELANALLVTAHLQERHSLWFIIRQMISFTFVTGPISSAEEKKSVSEIIKGLKSSKLHLVVA